MGCKLATLFASFTLLLAIALFANPQVVASDPIKEGLKGLQKQIEELRETQKVMQRDLQEIKALLQGRVGGAPNIPPPNLTVSLGGGPLKGDKNAKLTLIEFSDYQCPFCARHFRETLPQMEREYINTGKLKYVLRDFPLEAIHKDALKAAEAANCAGEQGKYWEMHDRLFQNQNELEVKHFPKHVNALGLDLSAFRKCLNGGKHAAKIRRDIEEGQKAGVKGTPTFFLGVQDSDSQTIKVLTVIHGAQPYAQFKEAFEAALSQLKK